MKFDDPTYKIHFTYPKCSAMTKSLEAEEAPRTKWCHLAGHVMSND